MNITKIELINFRTYRKKIFDKFSNLNITIGKNGIGKTSIIESIYIGSLAKSFKTNNEWSIITKGENFFKIKIACYDYGIKKNLELLYDKFGTNGQIAYAPKSNMIKYENERAEFKGTSFIKITGSKAEEKIWFLIERTYDPLTEEFVDSKYSISNKEVSKEEYMSQLNKTSNNYKWCETPYYDDLKNIDTYTIKNELEKYFQ